MHDSPLVCSWHLASAGPITQDWQPARCSLQWQYGSGPTASSSTACSAPPSEETPHRFWPGSTPGAWSGGLRSLRGLHPKGVCLQTGAGVSRDKSGNNRYQTKKGTLDKSGSQQGQMCDDQPQTWAEVAYYSTVSIKHNTLWLLRRGHRWRHNKQVWWGLIIMIRIICDKVICINITICRV